MPAPTDEAIVRQVKRAYLQGVPIVTLAKNFNVSTKSIERWRDKEGWDAERTANNVIDLTQKRQTPPPAPKADRGDAEALTIANEMITHLRAEMATGMAGKDKAAVSNALRSWLMYREDIQPRTVDDLVRLVAVQVGKWDLSITDFVKALRDRAKVG
jgi:hypothetical protein